MLRYYEKYCQKKKKDEQIKIDGILADELLFETQEIFYEIASNYPNFIENK